MADAKWTPGPWKTVRKTIHGRECFEVEHGEVGEVVCTTDNADPNQEADARLIAAAPELIRSLQECVGLLIDLHPDASDDLLAVVDARAAIAKAEGGGDA